MFKSEDILYYSIVFPIENSWELLNSIGDMGLVDF